MLLGKENNLAVAVKRLIGPAGGFQIRRIAGFFDIIATLGTAFRFGTATDIGNGKIIRVIAHRNLRHGGITAWSGFASGDQQNPKGNRTQKNKSHHMPKNPLHIRYGQAGLDDSTSRVSVHNS